MILRTKLAFGLALAGALALPGLAQAGPWQRHYPGRAEVNHRIRHQQWRITEERREGDITKDEAHALRGDLHDVRQQERAYAQDNGNDGHLTRGQVRDLNKQLNENSRAIGH
ncbi:MAG: hypothetical protein KGM17_02090 [Sphingomonadales bacterium]|nr:hypothetical protein [Sphingomonadales bacterium]